MITSLVLIETIALIAICLTVGKIVAQLLAGTAFELPTFVCVLFVGVILSNGLSMMGFYRVFERAVSVLGNVSLSLFLAMALMGLKLWELASLALPMLAILVVQTIFMALYAIFVTWRMMGKNYDAAVLAAGHCGFGLGATPTAIANMQAITERFGPSHMAFLVVPMVGAFFIDIVNALVIKLYLMLPILRLTDEAAVFSPPLFTHSSNVLFLASSVLSGLLPVVGNVREYVAPGAELPGSSPDRAVNPPL